MNNTKTTVIDTNEIECDVNEGGKIIKYILNAMKKKFHFLIIVKLKANGGNKKNWRQQDWWPAINDDDVDGHDHRNS